MTDGRLFEIPDSSLAVREAFGVDSEWRVPAFSSPCEHVPEVDAGYYFDPDTTLAILAGFAHNRRVLLQGFHGTGKSTHIEQIAARLNWPLLRINFDGHISRIDLIGIDQKANGLAGPVFLAVGNDLEIVITETRALKALPGNREQIAPFNHMAGAVVDRRRQTVLARGRRLDRLVRPPVAV